MDQGGPTTQPARNNRRKGRDRRRILTGAEANYQAQVLLAKLLGTIIGLLAGFISANIISAVFAQEFHELLDKGEEQYRALEQQYAGSSVEFEKLKEDLRRLQDKLMAEGIVGTPLDPSPSAPAPSAAAPDDVQPAPAETALDPPPALETPLVDSSSEITRYETLKGQVDGLRKSRDRLQADMRFWETEREDYRRNIHLVEMSSIAVLCILTLLGYLLHPLLLGLITRWSQYWFQVYSSPEPRLPQAVFGFFAGVLLAVVVILAVYNSFGAGGSILGNPSIRLVFGVLVVLVLGWTGSVIGTTFFSPPRKAEDPYLEFRRKAAPKILDTSVIIDGRIHDVSTAGFLDGSLVVTNSVLHELQMMADSGDERKRGKGRRGLELVKQMQEDPRLDVQVFDDSVVENSARTTDEQLIVVAQAMDGHVVTNDYQLNRVAAIRKVKVINLNALANAVKSNYLPGDFLELEVIDRGKQRGQGVGYLDDGTMVVVEDGEPYIGQTRQIKVTSVTQTAQGRLIFGRVDAAEQAGGSDGR